MQRPLLISCLVASMGCLVLSATGQERAKFPGASALTAATAPSAPAPATPSSSTHGSALPTASSDSVSRESDLRIEGERRFRTNCGRCHMPPHKFAPRVMATAIRHMRVRAMLTDEDMRLILHYMTQ